MPLIVGMLVLLSLLWGTAFVGIKEALDYVSPRTLTILRFAVADVALLALVLVHPPARPRFARADAWRIVALGVLGIPVYHLAINWGEHRTSAGAAALVVATAPVMVAVLSSFVLRERLTVRRALGIALAFAGVAVLASKGSAAPGEQATKISGVLVAMLAPAAWAVYTVIARPMMQRTHAMRLTATVFFAGGAMLLPLVNGDTFREAAAMPARGWMWLALLGVGSSVGGYAIFNWALGKMEATKVAVFLYMVPVVALLAASLILDEPLTAWVGLAAALVVGGVVLTERDPAALIPGADHRTQEGAPD